MLRGVRPVVLVLKEVSVSRFYNWWYITPTIVNGFYNFCQLIIFHFVSLIEKSVKFLVRCFRVLSTSPTYPPPRDIHSGIPPVYHRHPPVSRGTYGVLEPPAFRGKYRAWGTWGTNGDHFLGYLIEVHVNHKGFHGVL
mgnify:CR=1 FL=1